MTSDSSSSTGPRSFDPPLSAIKARQMGELTLSEGRWDVVLETARDPDVEAVRGRIHFVSGNLHRLSGWIFLEWTEKEIEARFDDFSAQEHSTLLSSLA